MTGSVKRFLPMLVVAALFVAALGMASLGAYASPTASGGQGLSAPQAAPSGVGEEPVAQSGIDLADPYDWRDPACAGWLLRYTLTFTNVSDLELLGVVLSDTLPAMAEYKESTENGIYDGVGGVQWQIGTVAAGQVISRELVIRPFSYIAAGTIITDGVAVLVDGSVLASATEGTLIERCPLPTSTPTPTVPSPTPGPTNTATPIPSPDGKTIWLPVVMNEFEH